MEGRCLQVKPGRLCLSAAKAIVGLRPSSSSHVRLGERGAPVDSLRPGAENRSCSECTVAGAKALTILPRVARLKSCPDTKQKGLLRVNLRGSPHDLLQTRSRKRGAEKPRAQHVDRRTGDCCVPRCTSRSLR